MLQLSELHRLIHTAPEPAWSRLGQKRSKIWSDKVTWSTGRGGASALWCCAQIKQTLTQWSAFWSFYQLKMIQEQWVWPKDWAGLKPVSSEESCGNNLNFEPFKLLIITFISTAHLSFWAHDSETTVFMFVWIETVVLVLLFWFCSGASWGLDVNLWSKLEHFAAVVQFVLSLCEFPSEQIISCLLSEPRRVYRKLPSLLQDKHDGGSFHPGLRLASGHQYFRNRTDKDLI